MNKYEEVIDACSNLIYMIINKYFRGNSIDDLYQVGTIGVMKAYDNYQNEKGAKFSTYAYKYIYGEIYKYIHNDRSLKIAKENYRLYKKVNEARNILSQKLMREPNVFELAQILEIDPDIIIAVCSSMEPVDSLDRVIYDSSSRDMLLSETISDERDYYNIDSLMLNTELAKLTAEEQKIIYLRYFEDKTQSEVAALLGINQVQVSRREQKTLKKIKENYKIAA